jgi:hypothetical protein
MGSAPLSDDAVAIIAIFKSNTAAVPDKQKPSLWVGHVASPRPADCSILVGAYLNEDRRASRL